MFAIDKHSNLYYPIVSDNLTDSLFLAKKKKSFITLTTRVDPIKKFAWQSSCILLLF